MAIDSYLIKKIVGFLSVMLGLGFLINGYLNDIFYFINLGIGSILIGTVILIFSHEKYLKYDISSTIFNDYIDLISKLIKNLEINTKGIVIPPRHNIKNGTIFLPLNEDFEINFAVIDDNIIFVNSDNKKEMGVVFSPLGKGFINMLDKQGESIDEVSKEIFDEHLSYALSLFDMGGDVNIKYKDKDITISYKIKENEACKKLKKEKLCEKIPCPVCGFVILGLARNLNKVLKINEIKQENNNVVIKLSVIEQTL
ncbi:MAG: hypothetical protein PWP15_60 [Methanothermococcus sp.]|jgi:hypothetical protein|uniref:hypothetical protein n=1 Tax=Methanothermococcus sp. TaxID=2614238 RepID=UPI00258DA349|nr:hypothetical protein [Methanothermococcus sp.]MDK2789553.1 hypothetical protein [Methanothermococcus sp.]